MSESWEMIELKLFQQLLCIYHIAVFNSMLTHKFFHGAPDSFKVQDVGINPGYVAEEIHFIAGVGQYMRQRVAEKKDTHS